MSNAALEFVNLPHACQECITAYHGATYFGCSFNEIERQELIYRRVSECRFNRRSKPNQLFEKLPYYCPFKQGVIIDE